MLRVVFEVGMFFLVGFLCFDFGFKIGSKTLLREMMKKYIILEKGSYYCSCKKGVIKEVNEDAE